MRKLNNIKIISIVIILISILVFFSFDFRNKKKIDHSLNKEKQNKEIWIDYIIGGPPSPIEFDGIDSLVKKWNINYKRIMVGCEPIDSDFVNEKKYKSSNTIYFKNLESRFGKNWKQKFDNERKILDSINFLKYNSK
jgi:hypothetical protein